MRIRHDTTRLCVALWVRRRTNDPRLAASRRRRRRRRRRRERAVFWRCELEARRFGGHRPVGFCLYYDISAHTCGSLSQLNQYLIRILGDIVVYGSVAVLSFIHSFMHA